MPYIKKEDREKLENVTDKEIGVIAYNGKIFQLSEAIETEGELNYTITRLCHLFLKRKGEKYSTYNTLIGVLECAKLELYRRKVAIYEDKKIIENNDVE
jgi:hypothetical protein